MNARAAVYAILTILGAVWTWHFNLQAINAGLGASDFFAMGWVNPVSSSLTADLTVACFAFLAWMPFEARRLQMRHWWVYIVVTFMVAFGFAFPLFLLMRERKMLASAAGSTSAPE